MSGIAEDGAFFHEGEMFFRNDVFATRYRYEDVTDLSSLFHRHYLESVHHGFHRLDRVHFRYDHIRSHAFGSHGNAFTAPTITGDNDIFAGDDEVRGAVDAVPY